MIERLIATTFIAMAIITIVPLSIASFIWMRNKMRKRKDENLRMLLELHKTMNRHNCQEFEADRKRGD